MLLNGVHQFDTETELEQDGFTGAMIDDLLGAPANELAEQVDRAYADVGERLWASSDVEAAKDGAVRAWLAEHEEPPVEIPEKYIAPEGFLSVKQLRALGFSRRQLEKLLPEPARVCVEGEDIPVRVWRAEDVKKAMKSHNFAKRRWKHERQKRDEAWAAVCAEYRATDAAR